MEQTGRLRRDDGVELAWRYLPGTSPTIVFLPGFRSDMRGSKAVYLQSFCEARGQAMLRLDYSGHGESGGAFTDGCIGRWTEDAALLIADRVTGELILTGSSMGGWIALLLAARLADRLAGIIGIAAAPDFTETLMWNSMMPDERGELMRHGQISVPSAYGEPLIITRTLIEEGRDHLLLGGKVALACKLRLLQGQCDPDVPWETALKLAAAVTADDVQITLIKDGDHRLSRPQDLTLLGRTLALLLGEDGGEP